jgi:hypothetical protein
MNWVKLDAFAGLSIQCGVGYIVDTRESAISVKLPKDVNIGDGVSFLDNFGTFGVHHLILDAGDYLFLGNVSKFVCDVPFAVLGFVFIGGSYWSIVTGHVLSSDSDSIEDIERDMRLRRVYQSIYPPRSGTGVRVIQL